MADIITAITTVFTAAIGWVGTVASTVTSTPILLFFCILGVVGLGIGLFRRLISVNQ